MTRAEQFETGVCLAFAPVAFTFVSAHFYDSGFIVRLLMGSMPLVVALVASVLARSVDWRWSLFRLWFVASGVAFFGSHLLLAQLARGLVISAAWYLEPFTWFPGVDFLHSVVTALCKAHVSVLVDLSPSLADVIRNIRVE